MKIQFNPDLEYQNQAIKAVTELFNGQSLHNSLFTIYTPQSMQLSLINDKNINIGSANELLLDNEDMLKNINTIRDINGLNPLSTFSKEDYNFAVEMETGTGKTYVFLKTIFELCKQYGFKKFIILVPSIAIKEGVLSSLRMLESHFDFHYKDFKYKYFQYNSEKLNELLDFARSDNIEIMIMTIQSLDGGTKVLHSKKQKHLEKTQGLRPIDIIKQCNPFVIIDEPQTTASTRERKEHIKALNPLCTLQYSATHKKEKNVHKLYRLTAIDAYDLKLVKQIEVASFTAKNNHNTAYIKLLEINATKTTITAKVEIDIFNTNTNEVERKKVKVKKNDNLYDLSNNRIMYENMIIERIDNVKKSITINGLEITQDSAINELDEDLRRRLQIRMLINEHFKKEEELNPKGIKVLSLFFLDKVANYRKSENGEVIIGKYQKIFEEEYTEIRKKYEKSKNIKEINTPVSKVHQGYFAEDKKGFKDTQGDSQDDLKAYESIMKDKEYLLSFENPIRFIFSHSALREGWDNPNVFQICTLNDNPKKNDRKRQEIGRGLRICVNQQGERVHGFAYNTLTVIANDSYQDYARALQTELEKEGGFTFGFISKMTFINLELSEGQEPIKKEEAEELFQFFKDKGYIDNEGKVLEKVKQDITNKAFEIPEEFKHIKYELHNLFKSVSSTINIKPKTEKIKYKINKKITENNPYFKELWEKIKIKTQYSVQYSDKELIDACAKEIDEIDNVNIEIDIKKARLNISSLGVDAKLNLDDSAETHAYNRHLPDIISFLQNSTNLTRETVLNILKSTKKLHLFYNNPHQFMVLTSEIINRILINFLVDGISYKAIPNSEYYLQEIFTDEELSHDMDALIKSNKSVYDYNYCDSQPEKDFASIMNSRDEVILYAKLPTKKFCVPTPIGNYTPDWLVILKENDKHNLYFVVETKSTLDEFERRGTENYKISCGKKRFEQVGGINFCVEKNGTAFIKKALKK